MRNAWMVVVCLLIGCGSNVPESVVGGAGGTGGNIGGAGGTGGEASAGAGGIGGAGGAGGEAPEGGGGEGGGGGETEICGPMLPEAPTLPCQGDTQCDDNDPCTADRCTPFGACCHSVVGGC